MRLFHSTLFFLIVFFQPAAWSATLCVENKNTQSYAAINQVKDCALPDALNRRTPQVSSSSEPLDQRGVNPSADKNRAIENQSSLSKNKWELRIEDGSVFAALKRWSVVSGWQLSWEIPVDFPIEIFDSSSENFEDAVRRVLTAFKVADYPPYPCFHENKVVRVVRRIQGNGTECQ